MGTFQKANFAESWMIRGPEVAVGVPNAERPAFCGTKQGAVAMPHTSDDADKPNSVVRAAVIFP